MNTDVSLTEFFYNIIPGSLFVILLKYYKIFDITYLLSTKKDPDSASLIFIYIATGFLFGFIFQGMTRLAREKLKWNYNAMKEALEENYNKEVYDGVRSRLRKELQLNTQVQDITKNEEKTLTLFYLMDNYLRGEKAAFLVNHYSSRYAFWSNIFFALLSLFVLTIILVIFQMYCHTYILLSHQRVLLVIFLICLSFYSKTMMDKYLFGFYDSMLKCFYMKEVFIRKKS